jgi:acyl carrier protein
MNIQRETLYRIISETLGLPAADLSPELLIRTLPNADSMRALEIVVKAEKAFNVEIPDEVTFNMKTIGEFEAFVLELAAREPSPSPSTALTP